MSGRHMPPPIRGEYVGRNVLNLPDLNLGTTQVAVRASSGDVPAMATPIKMIDVTGDARLAREVTITMGLLVLTPVMEGQDAGGGTTGPITGIVEWGNGAAFSRVEFDIPPVSRIPTPSTSLNTGLPGEFHQAPRVSGVALAVTASAVRVYARNDNQMPFIGNITRIVGNTDTGVVEPTVVAHVAYGRLYGASGNGHLFRTIAVERVNAEPQDQVVGIPPFAKRVYFFRAAVDTTSFEVQFNSEFTPQIGDFAIAAGSIGPIDVPSYASSMTVGPITGAVSERIFCAFEIVI